MWWPWIRHRLVVSHTGRLPDGDTVVPPGRRRLAEVLAEQQHAKRLRWPALWADLIRPPDLREVQAVVEAGLGALCAPTQPLPQLGAPLLTPGQRWRADGGGRL